MSDLTTGLIGPETKYTVKFEAGRLVAELVYDGKVLDSSLKITLDSDAVIEAIKIAIPGKIDDVLLDLAKSALKLTA